MFQQIVVSKEIFIILQILSFVYLIFVSKLLINKLQKSKNVIALLKILSLIFLALALVGFLWIFTKGYYNINIDIRGFAMSIFLLVFIFSHTFYVFLNMLEKNKQE